jgi:hypothetical protein
MRTYQPIWRNNRDVLILRVVCVMENIVLYCIANYMKLEIKPNNQPTDRPTQHRHTDRDTDRPTHQPTNKLYVRNAGSLPSLQKPAYYTNEKEQRYVYLKLTC